MRYLAALFLICLPLTAQSPKTVYVTGSTSSNPVFMPVGGTIMMLNPGEQGSAPGVAAALKKRCAAVTVVADRSGADYIVVAEVADSSLLDRSGKTIFTTKAKMAGNIAKDACSYLSSHP